MEALGGAASVIAVVQVTGEILCLCQTYFIAVRDARKDIKRLQTELATLNDALVALSDLTERHDSNQSLIAHTLKPESEFMKSCWTELHDLLKKLNQGQGSGEMSKYGFRSLKWPFSGKDVDKLTSIISRNKETISLIVEKDSLSAILETKDDILQLKRVNQEMSKNIDKISNENLSRQVSRWLAASDASINLEKAQAQCHKGTGKWLLNSSEILRWMDLPASSLWLFGPPGSGKTVYCSTIIDNLLERKPWKPESAVAYYFFDFKDASNAKCDSCLRTLIEQLAKQYERAPEALQSLYSQCSAGRRQPGVSSLLHLLKEICSNFLQVSIIIDALDECTEIPNLLDTIQIICDWRLENLHLLMTSQPLRNIEESLNLIVKEKICIQANLNHIDIEMFVRYRLQIDTRLRKWPKEVHEEIETAIVQKSNGMFRWAVCQLDALRNCINLDSIRKSLSNLPRSLDETYDRVFSTLVELDRDDVYSVLEWLSFSQRPFSLQEMNSAFTIVVDGAPHLNTSRLLPEPRDILTLCPGLANITSASPREIRIPNKRDFAVIGGYGANNSLVDIIQLSHSSVKDYLTSVRIKSGPFQCYSLSPSTSHLRLAKACLTYLLGEQEGVGALQDRPCTDWPSTRQRLEDFPFLDYSSRFWAIHARHSSEWDPTLEVLMLRLMTPRPTPVFRSWVQVLTFSPNKADTVPIDIILATPLYFAASFGLVTLVRKLLDLGADVNEAGGTFGGTPLHAAVWRGFLEVQEVLVEAGAKTDIRDFNNMTPGRLKKFAQRTFED